MWLNQVVSLFLTGNTNPFGEYTCQGTWGRYLKGHQASPDWQTLRLHPSHLSGPTAHCARTLRIKPGELNRSPSGVHVALQGENPLVLPIDGLLEK